MIDNLINGNVGTAKRQAGRFPWERIYKFLRDELAWSEHKSRFASDVLKGKGHWQEYCDAK